MDRDVGRGLGKKKKSGILGLGLGLGMGMGGGSMRAAHSRSGSTASSFGSDGLSTPSTSRSGSGSGRLSLNPSFVLSGGGEMGGRDRVSSNRSSLRPLSSSGESVVSYASGGSGGSGVSASVSVRWDEEGLESGRERRRRERVGIGKVGGDGKEEKESREMSDGRKRTPLTSVFPDIHQPQPQSQPNTHTRNPTPTYPISTIEEATQDGPGEKVEREAVMETPVQKARARPVSEQLLWNEGGRPKGICGEESGKFPFLSLPL